MLLSKRVTSRERSKLIKNSSSASVLLLSVIELVTNRIVSVINIVYRYNAIIVLER